MEKNEQQCWEHFFELGKSRLKSKEYSLAVKEFSKSIIFKNTANNYEIASSYLYRGNAHYYLKNLDKANDDLKKGILLGPNRLDYILALHNRMQINSDREDYYEIIDDAKKLITLGSNNKYVRHIHDEPNYILIIAIAYLKLGHYRNALIYLDRMSPVLFKNSEISKKATYYICTGWARSKLKEYESALEDFKKVLSIDRNLLIQSFTFRIFNIKLADEIDDAMKMLLMVEHNIVFK